MLFKGGTTSITSTTLWGGRIWAVAADHHPGFRLLGDALPFIFKNIDKVKGFKISMAIEAGADRHVLRPGGNVAAIFALVIIINIIQLAATPLQWSMLSDIIDAEKRSGKKLSGIVFQRTCLPSSWDRHRRRAGGLYAGMGRLRWRRSAANRLRAADDQAAVHRLPGVLVALLIVITSKHTWTINACRAWRRTTSRRNGLSPGRWR